MAIIAIYCYLNLNPETSDLIDECPKPTEYENGIFHPEKPTTSSQDCVENLARFGFIYTAFGSRTRISIRL